MKEMLYVLTIAALVSCAKEKDSVTTKTSSENTVVSTIDSAKVSTVENADYAPVFKIIPLDIAPQKGLSVFTAGGKTLFYFDQNANKGIIRIDGKDYTLNRFDFSENTYSLFGDGTVIEATNGDFKERTGECLSGVFPDVKVSLGEKVLNLSNINLQDCPAY